MEVRYLNTDLEIESTEDISRIIDGFGEDVIVLHHGETSGLQHVVFETAMVLGSADETIGYFCTLVESLPHGARKLWDSCCKRTFDIGYESGTTPHNLRTEIRPSTIERVAAIRAGILITVYSIPKD